MLILENFFASSRLESLTNTWTLTVQHKKSCWKCGNIWKLILKVTGWTSWWDKAISSWFKLTQSFQIPISGMRITNYMKKAIAWAGYNSEAATTATSFPATSPPLLPSSYLGAKGLQSTCSTFPQHPRVKGFTPPRNLPVTWKHIQVSAQILVS